MAEGKIGVSRRHWLCACAGGYLLSACGGGGDTDEDRSQLASRGCLSVSVSASLASSTQQGCGLPLLSTGNSQFDAQLRSEFNAQGNFWGIPGVQFAFLNDCGSPNALANPQDRSILFGIGMIQKLISQFGDLVPLWQVIAHEWGHQIQFALGDSWLNASTVAPKELEADMFSGFYLSIAKSTSNLSSSITNAFSLGDWDFNNPNHHGTPEQRARAVVAGARVALAYVQGLLPGGYPAIRQRFAQELLGIL